MIGRKAMSKWLIFVVDQVIICWSLSISLFIVLQFQFSEILRGYFFIYTGIYFLITTVVFLRMRIHTGIIRYSNLADIYRIFSAVLISSIIYWLAITLLVKPYLHSEWKKFSLSVLLNFFISSSLLIILRIYVRHFFFSGKAMQNDRKEVVVIFGSDESSVLINQALELQDQREFAIFGFIDDGTDRVNKYIQQKKVFSSLDLPLLKNQHKVTKMLLTGDFVLSPAKKMVIDRCIDAGIRVSIIPPSGQWLYGKLSLNQIQDLDINDLLQRAPIILNKDNIAQELTGKRILITGAAGSIGSEMVRQIIRYNPELIILYDQAESPLHELQLEIEDKYPEAKTAIYLANIRNSARLRVLFETHRPQIVFHAAAYKHVPLMEKNPCEAVWTNILGTKNLADMAVEYGVDKFVMISTDKAVNPTNVMGASKRIAEIYIQTLNSKLNMMNNTLPELVDRCNGSGCKTTTKFITTRFGNVLGSNGSVIPRFKSQIQNGGPITVTDPKITRYFMSIPEAVDLVMEAASMGKGGEIYIFDMGDAIKIDDLARKMIKLAGLVPDKDINIVYTGLRPGEKMYEELLNIEEACIPTHHPKIKIAKVILYPFTQVESAIKLLFTLNKRSTESEVVKMMKKIVPEYKSNNSVFEQFDLQPADTLNN